MHLSHKPFHFVRWAAVSVPLLASSALRAGPAGAADIDALLGTMTVEQKVSFLVGANEPESLGQAVHPGVPELGIPPLRLTDGPAGIRVRATATSLAEPHQPTRRSTIR